MQSLYQYTHTHIYIKYKREYFMINYIIFLMYNYIIFNVSIIYIYINYISIYIIKYE